MLAMHVLCRSFWRKKTQGFHYGDFFAGILTTSLVLGFVIWRKDCSIFRSLSRRQKGEAIQVLKEPAFSSVVFLMQILNTHHCSV